MYLNNSILSTIFISYLIELHRKLLLIEILALIFVSCLFIINNTNVISFKFNYFELFYELEFILVVIPSIFVIFLISCMLTSIMIYGSLLLINTSIDLCAFQWYWVADSLMINLHSRDNLYIGTIRILNTSNIIKMLSSLNYGISITGFDVVHSFGIPSLGVKIDAIPGRINYICLTVLFNGIYYGQCTELCGSLHAFMPFKINII